MLLELIRFPDSEAIVESCCLIVSTMCLHESNRRAAVDMGVVPPLLRALTQHAEKPCLTQAASSALLALLRPTPPTHAPRPPPSSHAGGGLDVEGRRRLVVEAGGVGALVGVLQSKMVEEAGVARAACGALLALLCPADCYKDAKGCGSGGGMARCCEHCARVMGEIHGARGDTRLLGCLPHLQDAGEQGLLRDVLLLLERMLLYSEHVQEATSLRRARDLKRKQHLDIFGEGGGSAGQDGDVDGHERPAGGAGSAKNSPSQKAHDSCEDGVGSCMNVRSSLVRANGRHAVYAVLEKERKRASDAAVGAEKRGGEDSVGGGGGGGGRTVQSGARKDVCDTVRRLLLRMEV